jgi:hypothetical protein
MCKTLGITKTRFELLKAALETSVALAHSKKKEHVVRDTEFTEKAPFKIII